MARLTHFPHPYYFYGSADSTDTDVIIQVPKALMPPQQHQRKALVKQFEQQVNLAWNATLVVITDGYLSDTIYPKAWIDSLNNSLWNTYSLHQQDYPNPLKGEMKRNYLLAIYKAVRTVLTMMTRTYYRPIIKPYLKGIHPFSKKIEALHQINFQTITSFNQKNTSDASAWKTIAFYMGQNISLIKDHDQIFTKKHFVQVYPDLSPFIYRQAITKSSIDQLNQYLKIWLKLIENWGDFQCKENIMTCRDECIDMKNEVSIIRH